MFLEKLGEALGVTYYTAQRYERGTDRISAGRLYDLAQGLRVTVGYFFKGAGFANTPCDMHINIVHAFRQYPAHQSGILEEQVVGALGRAVSPPSRPALPP